ncbi:hypothetical protein [Salipiger bermudensis]|uniref:hypothetical protein n=1 Tax=Salipiger bermudensis TaxID=344736 RepID=UPI003009145D
MSLMLRLTSSGPLPDGRDRVEMREGALTIGRGEENDLSCPIPTGRCRSAIACSKSVAATTCCAT